MAVKIFGQKLSASGRGRCLSILGCTPRADWRAVLVVALAAVAAGAVYAESRLAAVRDAAAAGELRRGGEDTLEVPAAADLVRALEARGVAPGTAATTSAATTTVSGQ